MSLNGTEVFKTEICQVFTLHETDEEHQHKAWGLASSLHGQITSIDSPLEFGLGSFM